MRNDDPRRLGEHFCLLSVHTATVLDMSNLEITPESPEPWEKIIRQHLAAGEHAKVTFERPSMTPAQMAESLGVSRATIMRRIIAGEIRTDRKGNRHRIPLSEVERFRHTYVREMAADLAVDF